ncbi:MAG TPA: FHA domain-containing protein, partial [Chroococcidiopsis sp.]
EDSPLSFLRHDSSLTDALLADCHYNLDELTQLLELVVAAPKRCQVGQHYIQAIALHRTTVLATNLLEHQEYQLVSIGASWLMGRSPTCAIALKHASVSRCHAVIGCNLSQGFYLTDLGSSNGTRVNRRSLTPHQRQVLRDGDLLQIGDLKAEFFLASSLDRKPVLQEATYH